MAIERIGVLLVHGIGTQTPNQHLIAESRNIVAALGEDVASISVSTEPRIADKVPDRFVVDYANNIVCVDVVTVSNPPRRLRIEFNEVYWADLGEKPTLPRQIKFWFWALSMWMVAGREYTRLVGFKDMYVPEGGSFKYLARFVLGFYGALFLLGAGTVGLLNVILDRLKLPRVPISDILTAYVGDVMLYSQPRRDADPIVSELGEPPRSEIRARMVDALVEFAIRDYSQWFILAHSLGSVVAYNGLMETEAALPNYLSEARWCQVKDCKTADGGLHKGVPPVSDVMLPRRPVWLAPGDGIDRKALFGKLRGLLTYGGALGKLRAIWPVIVPANTDEHVFRVDFEWFNVYEPTDPVSGPMKAYQAQGTELIRNGKSAAKIKQSIPYKAGWIWLLSHLKYLDCPSPGFVRPKQLLVFKVASWLIDNKFDAAGLRRAAPTVWLRTILRAVEVFVIGVVVWLAATALLRIIASRWLPWLESSDWPVAAHAALFVTVIFNVVGWLAGKIPSLHRDLPRWLRWLILAAGCLATCAVWRCAETLVEWDRRFWLGLGDWLTSTFGSHAWFKSLAGLLDHPGAIMMAIGLLSATVILIIVLGAIRWLFQPLPVQRDQHMKGWFHHHQ